jgi:hypothetical protein
MNSNTIKAIDTKQVFITIGDYLQPAVYYDNNYYYTSSSAVYQLPTGTNKPIQIAAIQDVNIHIPGLIEFNGELCVVSYIHNMLVIVDVATRSTRHMYNIHQYEIFTIYTYGDNVFIGNHYDKSIVQHLKFVNGYLVPVHIYKCISDPIPISLVNNKLYIYSDVELALNDAKVLGIDSEIYYVVDVNVYLHDRHYNRYFIYDYNSVREVDINVFKELNVIG